jgi:hypothetical protein
MIKRDMGSAAFAEMIVWAGLLWYLIIVCINYQCQSEIGNSWMTKHLKKIS